MLHLVKVEALLNWKWLQARYLAGLLGISMISVVHTRASRKYLAIRHNNFAMEINIKFSKKVYKRTKLQKSKDSLSNKIAKFTSF